MEGKLRRPRPEIVALLERAERGEISNGQAAVQAGVDPATIASWRVQLAQGRSQVGAAGQAGERGVTEVEISKQASSRPYGTPPPLPKRRNGVQRGVRTGNGTRLGVGGPPLVPRALPPSEPPPATSAATSAATVAASTKRTRRNTAREESPSADAAAAPRPPRSRRDTSRDTSPPDTEPPAELTRRPAPAVGKPAPAVAGPARQSPAADRAEAEDGVQADTQPRTDQSSVETGAQEQGSTHSHALSQPDKEPAAPARTSSPTSTAAPGHPRGHQAEAALRALLDDMATLRAENQSLRDELRGVQQQLREFLQRFGR